MSSIDACCSNPEICKYLYCKNNNLDINNCVFVEQNDTLFLIFPQTQEKVYDFCHCSQIDIEVKKNYDKQIKLEEFKKNQAYPYLSKLITKLKIDIEDIL